MITLDPHLWPDTAAVGADGHLSIGGCDVTELAAAYGTPLYLLDEQTLRAAMRAYRAAFAAALAGAGANGGAVAFDIHYASKALLNTALAQIVAQEGLGLDVVSAAELLVARRAGLPLARVHMHGNAKTRVELERALAWGVGAIVVDNLDELAQLATLSAGLATPQGVLLRIAPDIAAHTHAYIATGGADAKFGLPLAALDAAVDQALAAPGLRLLGLHAHIGSQIFAHAELRAAVGVLLDQAARIRDRRGVTLAEISPGGGLGVPYTADMPPADIAGYARTLADALVAGCRTRGLPLPRLTVEPGRSVVARAGVALYTVVARKGAASARGSGDNTPPSRADARKGAASARGSGDNTPPSRADASPLPRYIHIDGGMADNIRPALYGARYTALLANRAGDPPGPPVHVAGRYCESGDVLLRDAPLPPAAPGDLLAVAVAGAYTLSMASTYNLAPRPALLLLGQGQARLIQRRETEENLLARDLPLEQVP